MVQNTIVIRTRGLTKRYKTLTAVNNLDMEIYRKTP